MGEVTRLNAVSSSNNVEIDVASACVFAEGQKKISAVSKTKANGKIVNTFTCNIVGDNCKIQWLYDVKHFGKGQERSEKQSITFINMPAATVESGSIKCYGKNEEGLSRS